MHRYSYTTNSSSPQADLNSPEAVCTEGKGDQGSQSAEGEGEWNSETTSATANPIAVADSSATNGTPRRMTIGDVVSFEQAKFNSDEAVSGVTVIQL